MGIRTKKFLKSMFDWAVAIFVVFLILQINRCSLRNEIKEEVKIEVDRQMKQIWGFEPEDR